MITLLGETDFHLNLQSTFIKYHDISRAKNEFQTTSILIIGAPHSRRVLRYL